MKSALVRIPSKLLSNLFGLRAGVCIDAVFQDAQDHAGDSFSFRIRGAGQEHPEGNYIRYYSLAEIADPEKKQG